MSDGEPDGSGDEPPSDGRDRDGDAPLSDLADRVGRRRRDQADQADGETGETGDPTPDLDPELSEGPPPDPDEDPFDRMSVGEIDEETLWSSLGSGDTAAVEADAEVEAGADVAVDAGSETAPDSLGDVGPAPGVESVADAGPGATEHVVPKDKYCQSCPYLDDPPELVCTHEGTEIVEVVDSERFRVRNCPMVEDGVEPKG